MTLRLTLQSPHISIKAFPTVEIPDFTIITGRNGSGKSHLLDAIVQGRVLCDKDGVQVAVNASDIRSYSWANMVPQDPGTYSSDNSRSERMQVLQQARSMLNRNQIMINLRQQAQAYGLNQFSDQELLRLDAAEFDAQIGNLNNENFVRARDDLFAQHEQLLKASNANFSAIIDSAKTLGKSVFSITDPEMLNAALPNYGRTDLFQQSFARLFVEYRDIYVRNELV